MPEWGVKQDATPGVIGKTVGTTYVKPTRVGTYEVQCTELCGSGHGEMHFKNIHVLTQADFAIGWRRPRRTPPRPSRRPPRIPAWPSSTTRAAAAATRFTPAKADGKVGPAAGRRDRRLRRRQGAGKTKATDLAGFIKESIADPNAYIAKGFSPGVMPQTFATA